MLLLPSLAGRGAGAGWKKKPARPHPKQHTRQLWCPLLRCTAIAQPLHSHPPCPTYHLLAAGRTWGRREPRWGSTSAVQGPSALPVATTRGTPHSAAAAAAARTPGVSCCCALSSVPSTSLTMSSTLQCPVANASACGEAARSGGASWVRRGWGRQGVPLGAAAACGQGIVVLVNMDCTCKHTPGYAPKQLEGSCRCWADQQAGSRAGSSNKRQLAALGWLARGRWFKRCWLHVLSSRTQVLSFLTWTAAAMACIAPE